jgi:hypothetical protein
LAVHHVRSMELGEGVSTQCQHACQHRVVTCFHGMGRSFGITSDGLLGGIRLADIKRLDSATVRAIAVESQTDPATVRAEVSKPGRVHNMPRERVRKAMWARGYVISKTALDEEVWSGP